MSSQIPSTGTTAVGLSRRKVLAMLGAGAGAAAVAGAGTPSSAAPRIPFRARGRLRRRPNFLLVMCDEYRHPPVYETAELQAWRKANLTAVESLRRHGCEFTNNHVMAAACTPSRASIFTGQYPSLHGVSQTTGAAKSALESDTYWLDPTTVPTMGDWFRAAGYDTYYKGKWHVSDADLYQPGTHQTLPSYDDAGNPYPRGEQLYLQANQLDEFGFDGWIGPEPHGKNPLDSGSSAAPGGVGRDRLFAAQGVKQVKRLRSARRPWLMVTSFVNPHDTSLWGDYALAQGKLYLAGQLTGSTVPERPFDDRFEASRDDPLTGKPTAQASYRQALPQFLQPIQNLGPYHRFYYQMQANVDGEIAKVLRALRASRAMARDTIVIFISDHGELLGAHGLFEKWHQAYEETVRTPFIVHNPQLFPAAGRQLDVLTSNADLLPTMLGLAGADVSALLSTLRKTHNQARPLVGRDLSPLLLGERPASRYQDAQYFMTDDQISRGDHNISALQTMYAPVAQPASVESVFTQLPTGTAGAMERWKYNRYFDNPAFWSTPGSQDVLTLVAGQMDQPGTKTATTTVKTAPEPDQIEVYNVTADPTELTNLAGDPNWSAVIGQLAALLNEQRAAKRLTPKPVP